jgi:hypothetical protein
MFIFLLLVFNFVFLSNPVNPYRNRCKVLDWIPVAQDRDQWQAVVNMIMKLGVPQQGENFLTS